MPRYFYNAKTFTGEPRSGILEAKNEQELARTLRQEGCILISAVLEKEMTKKKKFVMPTFFFNRVSLTEKIMFTRNLKVMISAGISFPRTLTTLADQARSKKFKKALLSLAGEIMKGESFSEALSGYLNIFSDFFVSMVKVGEESGTLEEVLEVLIKKMEREHSLKSKIRGAMVYPAVILATMIGVGILMLIIVVPKLSETYKELNITLPFTTRLVVAIGNFLASFWYLIPAGIFIFLILLRILLKTMVGRVVFDSLVLKIPIIAAVIKKSNSAYTARTLGSLLSAGVPFARSLEITSDTLGNIYYKRALSGASEQIKKGTKLSQFLSKHQNIYPSIVIQMIAVGEETGQTAEILQKLADFFEEEVTNAAKNLSTIIEPVLMIIIGIIVGFFAISMIQPMYSMIQTLE